MSDIDTPERFEKLCQDVESAIISDATSNAHALATRYKLEPEYVEAMLPRTYMRVAIGLELKKAGCSDEVIRACSHHVWMLVNGVKSYSGE